MEDEDATVAANPAILTVAAGVNPVPIIVAVVPSVRTDGVIDDIESAAVTVTVAVPDLPSLVAVIVALPAATAVTRPLAVTLALAASDVAQVMTRSVSDSPAAPDVDALNCCVAPPTSVTLPGVTNTVATGIGITVSAASPVRPPDDAMIDTWPGATPETVPAAFTVAIDTELVDQVTAPNAMGAPFWSRPATLATDVWPT